MSLYKNPHAPSCYWFSSAEKFGAPNVDWCEESLCHWISEPANTYSNILFLILAFYILSQALRAKQKELIWFAPAMFVIGMCSSLYHLSNNYLFQFFDFVGIYLFTLWALTLNLRRLKLISSQHQIITMVTLVVIFSSLVHIMYLNNFYYQILIVLIALMIITTEFMCYIKNKGSSYRYLLIGFLIIFIAQVFSQLDRYRVLCDSKNHFFQGHAIWHLLAAIGLTFTYKHFEQFNFRSKIEEIGQ